MGRPVLAWFTIPAIILLTTVTTYTTGFSLRGGSATINRMAIVQVWPGVDQAQVDGVFGVLAPRRGSYTVSTDEGLTLHNLNMSGGSLVANNVTILEGRQYAAQAVPIDAGIAATFQASGYVKAPPISGTATLAIGLDGKASVQGVIHNESAFPLMDAIVMVMNTPINLGLIGAGETRQFRAPIVPFDQAVPSAINRTRVSIYNSAYYGFNSNLSRQLSIQEMLLGNNYNSMPYGANTPRDQELRRRARFLDGMITDAGSGAGRGLDIYLAGWSDSSPMGVQIDTPANDEDSTLYMVKLMSQLVAPNGMVHLLPGYMQWVRVGNNQFDYQPYSASISGGSVAQFQFSPQAPVYLGVLKGFSVTGRFTSSVNAILSVWDWRSGAWVALPQPSALDFNYHFTASDDLNRFVGPGTSVQVRIEPQGGNTTNIDRIDVVMDGTLGLPPTF
jgi:hypothetical protein